MINCLRSIEKSKFRDFEIIIFFDESTRRDANVISKNFPYVKVVQSKGAVGITKARNLVARFAKGNYLIYLDGDTKVESTWIEELVKAAQNSSFKNGIFGSHVAPYNGKPYYGGVHGVCDILGCSYGNEKVRYKIDPKYFHFEVLGFAFLIRREVFNKIGGWGPRIEFGGTDLDLCWRVRLAGHDVVKVPTAVVHHAVSFTKDIYHPQKVYLLERNTLLTIIKNYSVGTLIFILPIATLQLMLEAFFFYLIGRSDLGFAIFKAILWNLKEMRENWIWHLKTQKTRKVSDRGIMNKMSKKNLKALKLLRFLKVHKEQTK